MSIYFWFIYTDLSKCTFSTLWYFIYKKSSDYFYESIHELDRNCAYLSFNGHGLNGWYRLLYKIIMFFSWEVKRVPPFGESKRRLICGRECHVKVTKSLPVKGKQVRWQLWKIGQNTIKINTLHSKVDGYSSNFPGSSYCV